VGRVPASSRSLPPSQQPTHHASIYRQPCPDHRQSYHSLSGRDESWSSCTSASDDEDLMTSSSPSHVVGVTSSSSSAAPRQLSVSDLFTYQRPRQSQPRLPNIATVVNMAAITDHVTSRYWPPEPEIEDAAAEPARRARRLQTSPSFDDSAIDNQSASSGGSRAHNGGSRINQSELSTRCSHDDSSDVTSGHHVTQPIAVIPSSPDDITSRLMCLQMASDKRSRVRAPSTTETDCIIVYPI